MYHSPYSQYIPYVGTSTQIKTPRGSMTLPTGVQAKIHFYDPYDGRNGPTISTVPQFNRFGYLPCNQQIINNKVAVAHKNKPGQPPQPIPLFAPRQIIPAFPMVMGVPMHPVNVKTYTGSGVILFERNFNRRMTVILFLKTNGEYSDLGGKISTITPTTNNNNININLELNAQKETMEESAGLFDMKGCDLERPINGVSRSLDIKVHDGSVYKSYLVPIMGTEYHPNLPQLFGENRKILDKLNVSAEYREMSTVSRFYLKDIFDKLSNDTSNDINVLNISGIKCKLSQRVINILRSVLENKFVFKNAWSRPYEATYYQYKDSVYMGLNLFKLC